MLHILTITGSDNSGFSGLQQDIRVISDMGGHGLTSATSIVMQNANGIKDIIDITTPTIQRQVETIITDFHPKAVKVGLVRTPEAVEAISREIVGIRNIVVAPGIISSQGTPLIDDDTIDSIKRCLIPLASLLILRQVDAERLLGITIATDEDMLQAAQQLCALGAQHVMLRGGRIIEGRLTALLYSSPRGGREGALEGGQGAIFFSSYNIEGWQQHGVGGALSAAITVRLGMGDDVPTAIRHAHEYVHSRVVYTVTEPEQHQRPADIYNSFMNIIADNYRTVHDVNTYADRLSVSPRYLSMITSQTVSKSPKQVIADYLMEKSRQLLLNSRLSVKEIAADLGFTTTAIFCKFFKQQEGKTPTEFRNSAESLS